MLACEWYIISLMSHTCPSCCKVRCAVSELWSQSVSDALQTMLEETWGHLHNNIFYWFGIFWICYTSFNFQYLKTWRFCWCQSRKKPSVVAVSVEFDASSVKTRLRTGLIETDSTYHLLVSLLNVENFKTYKKSHLKTLKTLFLDFMYLKTFLLDFL